MSINQIITSGETIRVFVNALEPKGSTLYDSLSVILVNVVVEMVVRVRSYFDMEIAKEGGKAQRESKKEIHEGKNPNTNTKTITEIISIALWCNTTV